MNRLLLPRYRSFQARFLSLALKKLKNLSMALKSSVTETVGTSSPGYCTSTTYFNL